MTTLTYSGELTVTQCWCGLGHAVPVTLLAEKKRTGGQIFCPLGHSGVFKGSENDRLKQQLRDAEARLTHARDERDWERERRHSTERSLAATKGVLTRTKKRIAAGVCPCCHRTFQQLGRHMAGQHPDYVADEEAARG